MYSLLFFAITRFVSVSKWSVVSRRSAQAGCGSLALLVLVLPPVASTLLSLARGDPGEGARPSFADWSRW
jgi:hypothetical protein